MLFYRHALFRSFQTNLRQQKLICYVGAFINAFLVAFLKNKQNLFVVSTEIFFCFSTVYSVFNQIVIIFTGSTILINAINPFFVLRPYFADAVFAGQFSLDGHDLAAG